MRLAPRDTWPDLRVVLRPLPWTWRLLPKFYADDVDGAACFSYFEWLGLRVEWYANHPLFREADQ